MISGKARIAGVIGWPVEHSISPGLHNYWLKELGIDGVYIPLAVKPEHMGEALRSLPKLGLRGVNITIPHKEAVIAYLDTIDANAKDIGAVNTIVIDGQGKLHGSNTDAYGFMENIRQSTDDITPYLKDVLVLGAGGAARAVIKGLLDAGAGKITILNRTQERAQALADGFFHHARGRIKVAGGLLHDATLIINTTSVGLTSAESPLDLTGANPDALVTDIIYNPLKTVFLKQAKALGLKTVDGLGMLIHQAVPGFEVWFGQKPHVTPKVREYLLSCLPSA